MGGWSDLPSLKTWLKVKVDTGGIRSAIEFVSGRWLFSLPAGSLAKNLSMQEFSDRYRKPGTPLAFQGTGASSDVRCPDFKDWQLRLHPQYLQLLVDSVEGFKGIDLEGLTEISSSTLLCCPEDQECSGECKGGGHLCPRCQVPVCRSCRHFLAGNAIIPQGLSNDNWYGYVDAWIYASQVTWMEKTVASPFWTGLTLFSIGSRDIGRKSARKHLMHDAMYSAETRVAFKGQIFSAPMNWTSLQKQLELMDKGEVVVSLPITGSILASRVRVSISSGLVDLNKYIKQATVRRNVVVQLIRMLHDSGHPDYRQVNMREVEMKSLELADSNDATIPTCLRELLQENEDDDKEIGTDKAATPAERVSNEQEFTRAMDRGRPQLLVNQRDSDAQRNVDESRLGALSSIAELELKTGSELIGQFVTSYIPRVFNITLPWMVGGPDFPRQARFRRTCEDAPALSLDAFTSMMAARVEGQFRWDWDMNPGLNSLMFASKANTCMSMSLKRALRRGGPAGEDDAKVGAAAARIFHLLWHGEYLDSSGRRLPMRGDISKITQIIGLTQTEAALLKNYQFMSSKIPGTRQIRRSLNHIVFSSRVVYGCPVFMTVTPSERHSGLAIRLSRYRRKDPAITSSAQEFVPWIGYNEPSLASTDATEEEDVEIDLPEYDLRRTMTARDPLCCVYAFWVNVTCLLPLLYGLRMCPDCPRCVSSNSPCMDVFGSNATPMGGSAGRADAMVGAIEAQKAEGVLHLHLFLFLQMAHQFLTLHDIAERLKQGLLSAESMKTFVSTVRCASYPDVEKFSEERKEVEEAWPAYADDRVLSKAPGFVYECSGTSLTGTAHSSPDLGNPAWLQDGVAWKKKYDQRLQHVMSRMNHHIHPVSNAVTGERKPLKSCCKKDAPQICKGGFPLESEITDVPLIVCPCVAEARGLCTTGPRSLLGTTLPRRNEPWLNAGPSAWMVFSGDNGDIKFPHRMPIIPETHEKTLIFDARRQSCCNADLTLQMTYDMQAGQAVAAGYFGGYSAKMQDIGHKELQRLEQSLRRKVDAEAQGTAGKAFHVFSRRLLKDLESKGIIRTSVESLNLSIHANQKDVLSAECVRTFATVIFPASLLLKREEVETLKVPGHSVIAAVFHGKGEGKKTYTEAPFDLLYGFRGNKHQVDLFSPFEMLMFWSMEKISAPSMHDDNSRSEWTNEGRKYMAECKAVQEKPTWLPGVHFEAIEDDSCILLPDLPALCFLRHRWCWTKRSRPHVPVWRVTTPL